MKKIENRSVWKTELYNICSTFEKQRIEPYLNKNPGYNIKHLDSEAPAWSFEERGEYFIAIESRSSFTRSIIFW